MNIKGIITEIESQVNVLSKKMLEHSTYFIDLEQEIVKIINQLGHAILNHLFTQIEEPITDFKFEKDGKKFVYSEMRNLRFKDRFGGTIIRKRRCYKNGTDGGSFSPLDDMLGFENCKEFSPLMTYFQSLLGCDDAFNSGSKILSEILGFSVSSTAIQNNTEHVGEKIPFSPKEMLNGVMDDSPCELMIAEVDGTTSPQIQEQEGISGRESLKLPTNYKECNLIVVEKHTGTKAHKVYGGCYGIREGFKDYCQDFSEGVGQSKAKRGVFLGDGVAMNWEIADVSFPDFVQVLDYYHASEHLHSFMDLFRDKSMKSLKGTLYETLLWEGNTKALVNQMKKNLSAVPKSNKNLANREISYFRKNASKMEYSKYRAMDLPVGSGMIEATCKLIICRRFKGNGMRWKKNDNAKVLKVRLAFFNGNLKNYFRSKFEDYVERKAA